MTTTDCPVCGGSGELPTGRREWETGHDEHETCDYCRGDGVVDARLVDGAHHTPDLRYPAGGWI